MNDSHRQSPVLDHRTHLIAQYSRDLLRRLHRAAPHHERLIEVGLDHLMHVRLIVGAGLEVGVVVGEHHAGGIEGAVRGLKTIDGSSESSGRSNSACS